MPKMKTHRGAAKRFRVTATDKIKRAKANKSHLLVGKSAKRKRRLRASDLIDISDRKRMNKLLPYQA